MRILKVVEHYAGHFYFDVEGVAPNGAVFTNKVSDEGIRSVGYDYNREIQMADAIERFLDETEEVLLDENFEEIEGFEFIALEIAEVWNAANTERVSRFYQVNRITYSFDGEGYRYDQTFNERVYSRERFALNFVQRLVEQSGLHVMELTHRI